MQRGNAKPIVLVSSFAEVVARLLADYPSRLGVPVRHTSRAPAEGEADGVHFHFASREAMEAAIAAGQEYALSGPAGADLHATSHAAIAAVGAAGRACVLHADAQQAEQLAAARFDARFVLLLPRSREAAEAKLGASGFSEAAIAAELERLALEAELPERLPAARVLTEGASAAETYERLADAVLPGGPLIAICGPAGAGSAELARKLASDLPDEFELCVGTTTRAPAQGEVDGIHFHFSSAEAMEAAIAAGEFAEHAHEGGFLVGTSRAAVKSVQRKGKAALLALSVARARALKRAEELGPVAVFVTPPSLVRLEERLRAGGAAGRGAAARGGDGAEPNATSAEEERRVRQQLEAAQLEMAAAAEPGLFDHVVVNDEGERGYRLLRQKLTGRAPPVVLCGPSGVGKGTLIKLLLKAAPKGFGLCVSHTTRAPRPGEVDGTHYHFSAREAMEAAIAAGEFVEHGSDAHGNLFGTSATAVARASEEGKACVLDIGVQGARALKAAEPGATFLFVAPPSLEALEARLRARAPEPDAQVAARMQAARQELAAAKEPGLFDHVLVNDDLTATFCLLRALLTGMPPPVLICGPSGVGKGTLIAKLTADFPDDFGFCVSHTTRAPRPGEVDGVHYHFTTREAMEAAIANGDFVEHAQVHGNYYGTSAAAVESVTRMGKSCVLDLDVQGARNVKGSALGAVFIFVAPPSLQELEARLRGRGTETEEKVMLRLANARGEMAAADEPGFFDHVLVNAQLEDTYAALKRTISRYRTLHLSRALASRCLGGLAAEQPVAVPLYERVQQGYQIARTTMSLRGSYISDASLIRRFSGLHSLDLSHNKLASLAPLSGLRYLLSLDASFNLLDTAGAAFEPPINLQELNLSHNRIASASAAAAHAHLRCLDLSRNELECMAGLERLPALAELRLGGNQIGALGGLGGSPLLQLLLLPDNRIESAAGLPALAHLSTLDLSNNLLTSLAGLEGCAALTELLLARNAIANSSEMRHLAPLSLIASLDLTGNPVVLCGSDSVPYRMHVCQQLPSLANLDGATVTAEEKVGAAWHFGDADAELRKIRDKHLPPAQQPRVSAA